MKSFKTKLKEDTELIDKYKFAPAKAVQAVDRLIKLKKNKNKWVVIKEILKIWASTKPTEYKSFVITLTDTKETRKKTWVGTKEFSGVTKTGDSYGRAILDLPVRVHSMIRALYKADELKMDRKFFDEFCKRFPKFKIARSV